MGTFRGVELDDLTLSTARLELRPWHDPDAPRVAEVLQDPRMLDFLALPRPYTLDHARAYVRDLATASRRDGSALDTAVVERSSGRLVGSCLLRLGRVPEVGYWTAPDAWGHGYAAEATRGLVEWGFGVGLHRIELLCSTHNPASVRTALAAGFRFEGIARDGYTVETPDATAAGTAQRGDRARFARLDTDPGTPIAPSLPRLPAAGLSDGVVQLRVMTPADASGLRELDDEVARAWNFDGQAIGESQARDAASDAELQWLVGRTGLRIAIVDAASGTFAGGLSLRLTGPPGVGLLGYGVHPAFRGRGFTTRALRVFAGWAFDVAGLARLELGARTGNTASRRAAENAGFEFEAVFRGRLRDGEGRYHDEARYALLRPAGAPQPVSRISP
ncbi:GNAT family N-acetyltransferase [Jatrophihabitans endophyticus]|uniref:GNAT family N-acetyltransferase n=1 Tax=Jatrophihabitans endophyticus TaxID=1206085 RepID=UPI0019F9BB3D|nr:GNAT family N-acetyltransferase [Jatrophihabitans endophyticus]MBE7188809.1 GNAT N-acetyltransferase [Jatrophihabitans endophyticus]